MSKTFYSTSLFPFSIGTPPGLEPAHLAIPLLDAELDVGLDVIMKEIYQQRTLNYGGFDLTSPKHHRRAAFNRRSRTRKRRASLGRVCQPPFTDSVPNSTAADISLSTTCPPLSTTSDARTCLQTPKGPVKLNTEWTRPGRPNFVLQYPAKGLTLLQTPTHPWQTHHPQIRRPIHVYRRGLGFQRWDSRRFMNRQSVHEPVGGASLL